MCGPHGGRHRVGHARGDVAARAQREERRPGSRQAAAERAGIDRRALDRGQARHERRPARLGDRVLERSADQREVAAVQAVDERAEVRPLAHGVGERHRVAEQRPRLRRLDLEIGMHDHRGQAGRNRQPDDVGRVRRGGRARSRRRCDGAMLSACADPAPSRSPSSAQAISVSIDALRAEQRVDRDDRRRGARRAAAETARERQALADASARRRAARRASSAAPAPRRPPCSAPRRAAGGRRRRRCRRSRTPDAGQARRHFVAGRVEREAEHVEAARDVRHGRGRKGGHRGHER